MPSGLVVLEGRWENRRNISVRSVFDLLMDLEFESIHDYHFENFATGETLRSIISHVCGPYAQKRYIYIGAHGENDYIFGSVDTITRTHLNNTLRECLGGQIRGIFFGSCLFCNDNNVEFFFEENYGVPNNVRWIAGYGRSVDWIQSTALDIIFWQNIFRMREDNPNANENFIIEGVCGRLNEITGGLMTELKFQVFRRRPGSPHEPEALIEWE